jgi:Zn-dependent protease/predicted transcriptional regulator
MFGHRLKLFKLFGFEVRLDASWIFLAVLMVWSLAGGVFPRTVPGLPARHYWWMGVAGALGLFGSIVFHELCHSLVASRHRLPMRGITLFVFGGVAEMGGEPESPKIEFLMAIAGPIASAILGVLCYFVTRAALDRWPPQVLGVVGYLSWINLALAAFNLIPAFPLDGGRVLRSILWYLQGNVRRATRIASRIGVGFGFAMMVFGAWAFLNGNMIGGIWYFLIGMFLQQASRSSYQQVVLRELLAGEPVQHFMKANPVTVRPYISVRELVDDFIYRYHYRMFPVVTDSGDVLGCVGSGDVKQIPREEWSGHTVREIAKPVSEANMITPETDALNALAKMRDAGTSGLMVTDHGRLLAIVSLRDLLKLLATKLDLEGDWSGLPRRTSP